MTCSCLWMPMLKLNVNADELFLLLSHLRSLHSLLPPRHAQASDGGSTASTSAAVVPRKSVDAFPASGLPPLTNGGGSLSPAPCTNANGPALPPPSLPPPLQVSLFVLVVVLVTLTETDRQTRLLVSFRLCFTCLLAFMMMQSHNNLFIDDIHTPIMLFPCN